MTRIGELTPSLATVIQAGIQAAMDEAHFGLPAKVTLFNEAKGTVDVEVMIMKVYLDENDNPHEMRLPPIHDVPVLFPGGGGMTVRWTLVPDDTVYLAFAERSMDAFMDSGGTAFHVPSSNRRHDLADAVAIAALRPTQKAKPNPTPGALWLGKDDGVMGVCVREGFVELGPANLTDSFAVRGTSLAQWIVQLVAGGIVAPPGIQGGPCIVTPPPADLLSTAVKLK